MSRDDPPMPELPRYRCHKEVHAVKIADRCVRFQGSDDVWSDARLRAEPSPNAPTVDWGVVPEDPQFEPIWVGVSWVAKHNPQSGGYFVVYGDGYTSFSPAKAFEEGYTLVPVTEPCHIPERPTSPSVIAPSHPAARS